MAEVKITPPSPVILPQPVYAKPSFQQQAFGPWTSNDPKVQRTIVRTRASSGITQRRFQATYPPAPTISETRTALAGGTGFEFSINIVNSRNVAGYNVYSSATNNANIAALLKYQPQPPVVASLQVLKIQDITAASPFYWVASVNSAGKESARVPVSGNSAPTPPPTSPVRQGASSGSGSGGGAIGGGFRGRFLP